MDRDSNRNRCRRRDEKDEKQYEPCPNHGLLTYITYGAFLIGAVMVPWPWDAGCSENQYRRHGD
jgi:hypothetical protein